MTKRRNRPIGRPGRVPKPSHARIAEEVFLQPWFLPRRVAFAIHELVPPDFWNKMRYFFEDYGCMLCEKETGYHSNGMCEACHRKVRVRVANSVIRHSKGRVDPRLDIAMFRQQRLAKKLLHKFSLPPSVKAQRRRLDIYRRYNPIYEALSGHIERA
jgi:hypothetical protein